MEDKSQYFKVEINVLGNEYNVIFADHEAYLDGLIRTPTSASGGVEIAQQILINGDGTWSVFTDQLVNFDELQAATEFAIASAIADTPWRVSTTTREERVLMVARNHGSVVRPVKP
jgi:hypothetical protein